MQKVSSKVLKIVSQLQKTKKIDDEKDRRESFPGQDGNLVDSHCEWLFLSDVWNSEGHFNSWKFSLGSKIVQKDLLLLVELELRSVLKNLIYTYRTIVSQIIAGHVVTVNETTYQNDNSNTFFRVRVVDVKPLNETADGSDGTEEGEGVVDIETTSNNSTSNNEPEREETTTQARSVETVEDFDGNKIPDDSLTAWEKNLRLPWTSDARLFIIISG